MSHYFRILENEEIEDIGYGTEEEAKEYCDCLNYGLDYDYHSYEDYFPEDDQELEELENNLDVLGLADSVTEWQNNFYSSNGWRPWENND
jgi:hypothetical protein